MADPANQAHQHALRVERVLDQFEAAWRAGTRPDWRAHLPVDQSLWPLMVPGLIRIDCEHRQRSGETPSESDYAGLPVEFRDAILRGMAESTRPGMIASDTGMSQADATPPFSSPVDSATILSPAVQCPSTAEPESMPSRLGRYEIRGRLGQGGFGTVYLAWDPMVGRDVAIKRPRLDRNIPAEQLARFADEARMTARVQGPGIVTVYDVFEDEGVVCIVQQYVQGESLRKWMIRQDPPLDSEIVARLVADVAEIVGRAHQQQVVHRDLKPENILLDSRQQAHVLDFGLALHVSERSRWEGVVTGTWHYLSPEQVRGQTHRIDARSDLWAIGVLLYELLSGTRPFLGQTPGEIFEAIKYHEPQPLRQLVPTRSLELERICAKCLSKQPSARYTTAADLAHDLRHAHESADGPATRTRHWPRPAGSQAAHAALPNAPVTGGDAGNLLDSGHPAIVPKGLRSFDAEDAGFFLELLPGPRTREGLPQSLQFWKSRIESTDPSTTFAVGLLHGPSGCGKSSLLKAGLLPRLAADVRVVRVEATPDQTERQLAAALRCSIPQLPEGLSLPELVAGLRDGSWLPTGQKVLFVIDQFEQWLHTRRGESHAELLEMLRHCDGLRTQALLLVRDDFWTPIGEFFEALDLRIVDGQNASRVSLFDPPHARRVLAEFGKANGRLPANLGAIDGESARFLDQAIAGLTVEGKVICVQLALFADMLHARDWTPATLADVGGAAGVGVSFLEETFSSRLAHPRYLRLAQPIRAVLRSLLPESGTDIRGHRKSRSELALAAEMSDQRRRFDELLTILDGEVRLITPVEAGRSPGRERAEQETGEDDQHYQLTHDYLVPSLRTWLTSKQRETRRGRAELLLAERAGLWSMKPENRHLPSPGEHLSIRWLTEDIRRSPEERRMLRKAARVHGTRLLFALSVLGLLIGGGWWTRKELFRLREEDAIAQAVQELPTREVSELPALIERMHSAENWPLARSRLLDAVRQTTDPQQVIPLRLALLPDDSRQLDELGDLLLEATPAQFLMMDQQLQAAGRKPDDTRLEDWWEVALNPGQSWERRSTAACGLAAHAAEDGRWSGLAVPLMQHLVDLSAEEHRSLSRGLYPARRSLRRAFLNIFRAHLFAPDSGPLVAESLAQFLSGDGLMLADAIGESGPETMGPLLDEVRNGDETAIARLEELTRSPLDLRAVDPLRNPKWASVTPSVVEAIESSDGLIDERWAVGLTLPVERLTELCETLRPAGYRPVNLVIRRQESELVAAVVWTRDAGDWRLAGPIALDEALREDERRRLEGFEPVCVAGVADQSFVLWHQGGSKKIEPEIPLVPVQAVTRYYVWSPNGAKQPPADWNDVIGGPVLNTTEKGPLNLEWSKAPLPQGIQDHHFATVSEAVVESAGGPHVLWSEYDDGIRVWFDDQLVMDHWTFNDPTQDSVILDPAPGSHSIRVEYFQIDGGYTQRVRFGRGRLKVVTDGRGDSSDEASAEESEDRPADRQIRDARPSTVLAQCRQWQLSGWRPTSVVCVRKSESDSEVIELTLKSPRITEELRESIALRRSRATIALARLGRFDPLWAGLSSRAATDGRHPSDPRHRSQLILDLGRFQLDPTPLLERLQSESDPTLRWGLCVALGRPSSDSLPVEPRPRMDRSWLLEMFRTDADAGVHGVLDWLLRRQGAATLVETAINDLRASPDDLSSGNPARQRGWCVNSQGQTLVLVPGTVTAPESATSESGASRGEIRVPDPLRHRVAVSTTLVTRAQYHRFLRETGIAEPAFDDSTGGELPQTGINWFEAARYCNWLSTREGLVPCYEPNLKGEYGPGMRLKRSVAPLRGYRLPTVGEWESVCYEGATMLWIAERLQLEAIERRSEAETPEDRLTRVLQDKTVDRTDGTTDRSVWNSYQLPSDIGMLDMPWTGLEWSHELQAPDVSESGQGSAPAGAGSARNQIIDSVSATTPMALMSATWSILPYDPPWRSAFVDSRADRRRKDIGFRVVRTVE